MASLREKIETAFKRHLDAAIPEGVYTGLGDFNVEWPAVICSFLSAEEIHPQASTFTVEVMLTAISDANPDTTEQPAAKHNELFGRVVDLLEVDDLKEKLMSAEPGLLVNGIERTSEEQPDISEEEGRLMFSSAFKVQLVAGHK